jgi:hypothetical protein
MSLVAELTFDDLGKVVEVVEPGEMAPFRIRYAARELLGVEHRQTEVMLHLGPLPYSTGRALPVHPGSTYSVVGGS